MADSPQNKPEVTVVGDNVLWCGDHSMCIWHWEVETITLRDANYVTVMMPTQEFLALADALRTQLEGPAIRKTVGYIDVEDLGILTGKDFEEGTEVDIRAVKP